MKTMFVLTCLWLGLSLSMVEAQVVKDPLLDYYQSTKAGDSSGDKESHFSPQTPIYYFEANFTGNGRKSFFITDDESREGPHGTYGWSVYYPLASGGYQKLDDVVSMGKFGPAYVGYVAEIKGPGIVDSGKHVVSVQYLSDGQLKTTFLGKNQEAEKENYPKYFGSPPKWQIQKTTLAQLARTYANPDPANVITPAAQ